MFQLWLLCCNTLSFKHSLPVLPDLSVVFAASINTYTVGLYLRDFNCIWYLPHLKFTARITMVSKVLTAFLLISSEVFSFSSSKEILMMCIRRNVISLLHKKYSWRFRSWTWHKSVGFRKKNKGLKKHIIRILGRHGSKRSEFVDPQVVCNLNSLFEWVNKIIVNVPRCFFR